MLIGKLNVGVSVRTQRVPSGQRKTLSTIFIHMGEMVVAERTIPARWNEAQALAEFKRFPDRFIPRDGFTPATVKAMAA